MQETWEKQLGPDIAAHTKVESWDEQTGNLVIACESTAWRAQLIILRDQLVDRLNEDLGRGTVRHIVFNAPEETPDEDGDTQAA